MIALIFIYVQVIAKDNIFIPFNHSCGTKINNIIMNVNIAIGKLKELDITRFSFRIVTFVGKTWLNILYFWITNRFSATIPLVENSFR